MRQTRWWRCGSAGTKNREAANTPTHKHTSAVQDRSSTRCTGIKWRDIVILTAGTVERVLGTRLNCNPSSQNSSQFDPLRFRIAGGWCRLCFVDKEKDVRNWEAGKYLREPPIECANNQLNEISKCRLW